MPPRLVGRLDIPALLAVAALSVFAWLKRPGSQGARATAFVNGKPVAWWPLNGVVRRDTVIGILGPVVVEHGEGAIRIVQAPCPTRVCLKQGKASHQHDQLVCVPSRMVVAIEGETGPSENQLDAVH